MVASRLTALALAAGLAYLALPGTFLFDDHSLFAESQPVPAWLQPRPVTYLTFATDKLLWGRNAAGFRLTNLLIHLGAAFLLFRLARRYLDEGGALFAAALFALHPANGEPLFYVFARSSSLAALFCLAAFELWLSQFRWLAVAAFAVALGAKEECAAFPLVLALHEWGARRPIPKAPIAAMIATACAAGARVIYSTAAIGNSGSGFGQSTHPWPYFEQQGAAIWIYLSHIAAPFPISIDPPIPPEWAWAWIPILAAAVWTMRSRPRPESPALWFLAAGLLLLPSSSVLPAADAMAYRRIYLPMAALAIGAALAVPARARLPIGAVLAIFGLMLRPQWQSEEFAWRHAHEQAPEKLRPVIQLSRAVSRPEALRLLEAAKTKNPRNADLASHLGRVHLEMSNPALALSEFGKALALEPADPRHLQNRGVALYLLNQNDAARADFERALTLDPCLGAARINLEKLGGTPPPPCLSTTASNAK
ncbi:MAG: hypothetical protein FJW30_12285 [Acidobacteria bacterium]|nr:hypothetical protein [Acidobacteriota bacterium]